MRQEAKLFRDRVFMELKTTFLDDLAELKKSNREMVQDLRNLHSLLSTARQAFHEAQIASNRIRDLIDKLDITEKNLTLHMAARQ